MSHDQSQLIVELIDPRSHMTDAQSTEIPLPTENNQYQFERFTRAPSTSKQRILLHPASRKVRTPAEAWEHAHEIKREPHLAGLSTDVVARIEPNRLHSHPEAAPPRKISRPRTISVNGNRITVQDFDQNWSKSDRFADELSAGFSQLGIARGKVNFPEDQTESVKIGHIDTGYDPKHVTIPARLLVELGKDFVEGNPNAEDPYHQGILNNPGHGTGTLSILSGNRIQVCLNPQNPTAPIYKDYLGGAPMAFVIPIRVADSVIRLFTKSLHDGIMYAVSTGCNVITISMGGLPTFAWADAINDAYSAGVVVVAATANNIYPFTPRCVLWPARYDRVVGASGVQFNGTPYKTRAWGRMSGNFGPKEIMQHVIAATTPNIPWAAYGASPTKGVNLGIDLDGAGTSSATPQVAAAVALWIQAQLNAKTLTRYTGWERAEAARQALFDSAYFNPDSDFDETLYFGRGRLQADEMLNHAPKPITSLQQAPAAATPLKFLDSLIGQSEPSSDQHYREMIRLEIAQALAEHPSATNTLSDSTQNTLTRQSQLEFISAIHNTVSISPTAHSALTSILNLF